MQRVMLEDFGKGGRRRLEQGTRVGKTRWEKETDLREERCTTESWSEGLENASGDAQTQNARGSEAPRDVSSQVGHKKMMGVCASDAEERKCSPAETSRKSRVPCNENSSPEC